MKKSDSALGAVDVTFSGSGTFQKDTDSNHDKSAETTANKPFVTGSQSMAQLDKQNTGDVAKENDDQPA